eukprot:7526504-Pyramimonas_sp.AAC.1
MNPPHPPMNLSTHESTLSTRESTLSAHGFRMEEYEEAARLYTLSLIKNTQHTVDDAVLYNCRSQ